MPLAVGPLTREAFAPFGQVLMAVGDDVQRQEFAAQLKNCRPQATLNMAFIPSKPSSPPWHIHTLERHPYSGQSFVPVQGTRFLAAVCLSAADGSPDVSRLTVFVAKGTQAVNYNPNIWHVPHMVLGRPGMFIMLRWDCENAEDAEYFPVDPPIRLSLAV